MAEKKPGQREGKEEALSFEESLDRAEKLIGQIEGGEIGLEESIEAYERGMAYLARCEEILKKAEQRVEELSRRVVGGGGVG